MTYKYKIDTTEGEIELELEITYHEPSVPDTREDPGHGGDIDYEVVGTTPQRAFIPNGREEKLILEFLFRQLEIEKNQLQEDFELRGV